MRTCAGSTSRRRQPPDSPAQFLVTALENMPKLLVTTIFLPLVGVLLIGAFSGMGKFAVRQCALVTTLVTFGLVCVLIAHYNPHGGTFAESSFPWLKASSALGVRLSLGLDGLSIWLFGLSALLMVTSVLVSWEAIDDRPATFYALLLVLETGTLGVFAARDIILFYVFFEFTLIPLFFLIGVWGSEDRRYAATKFFLYTLGRQLAHLSRIVGDRHLGLHPREPDDDFFDPRADRSSRQAPHQPEVPALDLWSPVRGLRHQSAAVSAAHLAAAGARPGPHRRQRDPGRHLVEDRHLRIPAIQRADVAGRHRRLRALAALALGGRHHLRALVALAQTDIKRLIAYSSVSHLGFCMLGLFALNRWERRAACCRWSITASRPAACSPWWA